MPSLLPDITSNSAPSMESVARPHLGYLDSLRALAAIYVVLHHAYLQVDFDKVVLSSAVQRKFLQIFWFGHFAVNFFIVLSGFCLMLPIVRGNGQLRGGWRAFFGRRARRMLPPYYASLILSLTLIYFFIGDKTGHIWDLSLPVTVPNLLSHLLVVHDLVAFHANNLNYPCWSIAVEWRIYFLFPLLLMLWRRVGMGATVALSVLVSLLGALCVALLLARVWTWHSNLSVHYVGLFTLGIGAATAAFGETSRVYRLARRVPWILVTPAVTFLTCALVYYNLHQPRVSDAIVDVVVGAWAALLLLHVSLKEKGLLRRVLDWQPLVFVGSFSYSLYLVHAPLLQLLWQYGTSRLKLAPFHEFLLLCAVGTPLIMIASYGFFLLAEKPFLSRRTRGTNTRPVIDTATAA